MKIKTDPMASSLLTFISLLEMPSLILPDLSSRHKCTICHSILKNAKQKSCGCKVCEKCLKDYLSQGPKPCPSKQPDCSGVIWTVENVYQDNATNKEIGNFVVTCPFECCVFSSSVKQMVDHIKMCGYREIECSQCKEKIKVKSREHHDEELCEMRNVHCEYCNKKFEYKYLKQVHLNVDAEGELCSRLLGICPNQCSVTERVNLKDHLKVCDRKKVCCPFSSFGCQSYKMTAEDLSRHLLEDNASHCSTLVSLITNLQSKVRVLSYKLKNERSINKTLMETVERSSKYIMGLNSAVEELSKRIASPVQKSNTTETFRNGSFIWKITDFESKRMAAANGDRVSITSDAFYTSEFGYKMCLRIYPAGDGIGKGTHLSVFFAIMKGDFDDILSWPFDQRIKLSILNHECINESYSDNMRPDNKSACYAKPSTECNVASGSPKFVLLSLLENNSKYCKNDTIYLRICVQES